MEEALGKAGQKKWEPRKEHKTREKKHYRDDRQETTRCYQCRERGHLARSCPYIRQSPGYRDVTEPMEVNLMDLVKTYDSHKKRYVYLPKRRDESGSSEEDSARMLSSGEESAGLKKGMKRL
ncbi:hypothetical protein AAG570_013299 [Ranatra chinensis]|uniref:CCHC-type domain-containing protein n=1 Tax=Ranatra chinensis TaxID=642074 RepID=A0ABD0YGB7_9HEMI